MISGRNETIPLQRRESNFYSDLSNQEPGPELSLDAIKLNIDNLSKMIAKTEAKTEAEAKKQAKISKRRYRCQTASISFLGMVCLAIVAFGVLHHLELIKTHSTAGNSPRPTPVPVQQSTPSKSNPVKTSEWLDQPTDAILVVGGRHANKSSEILPHTVNAYKTCDVPELVPDKTEDNFLAIHEDTNSEKKVGILLSYTISI